MLLLRSDKVTRRQGDKVNQSIAFLTLSPPHPLTLSSRNRAFTMIEIIVVVIIIAVLAALIGPRFFGEVGKAKSAVAQQKLKVIEQAVEKFYYEHNRFPSTLNELVERPSDVPEDQWNPMLKPKDLTDPW